MDKLKKGIFNNNTTWAEIDDYVSERISNPLLIELEDGSTATVINLNPHSVDFKHLCEFLEKNIEYVDTHVFIIPHSMSAIFGLTFDDIINQLDKPFLLLNYRKNKYLAVYPKPEFDKIFTE
ncbi:MAG: hypothetical protein WC942_03855 [Clostridia bacterium]|jgi:hypothetical protein